jgi:hypothetical protein
MIDLVEPAQQGCRAEEFYSIDTKYETRFWVRVDYTAASPVSGQFHAVFDFVANRLQ